jgi:hypothetical protein
MLSAGRIVEGGTFAELGVASGQFAAMLTSERWNI